VTLGQAVTPLLHPGQAWPLAPLLVTAVVFTAARQRR
jgi:hypothetical protein